MQTHLPSTDAQDYHDAAALIVSLANVAVSPVAIDILQHAAGHLQRRLRAYLCPSGLPRTEQQAAALLKGIGLELAAAGRALQAAAAQLKAAGRATHASTAHQAGTRALAAAEGLA